MRPGELWCVSSLPSGISCKHSPLSLFFPCPRAIASEPLTGIAYGWAIYGRFPQRPMRHWLERKGTGCDLSEIGTKKVPSSPTAD